LQVFISRNQ